MKFVVGITGSIACGKSYVSSFLKEKGYIVIDSDIISHEVIKEDFVLNKLKNEFSDAFVNDNLDRKLLGNIIFNDESKRIKLNNIMHPIILDKIKSIIKINNGIIFVDVPLLYESKFDIICDKVICVYTDYSIQLDRLIKRDNITKELAIKKISSQMPIEEKIKKSNYLIYSDIDFNVTKSNIVTVLNKIEEEYNAKSIRNK